MARRSDHSREELYDMALDAARRMAERDGLRGITSRGVAREMEAIQALENAASISCFGVREIELVDHGQFVVANFRSDCHSRGQLQGLAGQRVRIIAIVDSVDVPTTAADTAASLSGTGVTRPLLAIHLLGGTRH